MLNIASFLIKQSNLISDDVRRVGIIRDESSPYSKGMQERRRAREESERLGWEKLQNTLRTGQGYQDWMGEYFLEGLGLRNLKQLDDPKVQEYFLRRAEGKDPGNMFAAGLYQPAGFFKKRDSGNRLLNAAVEYIKNKRNAASVKPQETSQPVSTSAPVATPAPTATPLQNPLGEADATGLDLNTEVSDADAFANAASSSLGELGQYNNAEDTDDFDSSIEDPDLIAKQVNLATPVAAPLGATEKTVNKDKSTAVKNPLISIQQARELLAKGIAPTSAGGYSQILGSDGTNALAQQELELMDKDPTYNPFANIQAKHVQKLNRMRLLDQYNPEVIMAENQRIQQNQAKLDADRRSRMDAAKYYAGQGVQGARDYHSYMTRGGQLSQAGQQWRDNFDVAGWNQQQAQAQAQPQAQLQQVNKTKFRAQQPTTNPVLAQAPLGVKPRPVDEQASMRKTLGHADTGVGVGSHEAANTYNTANNKANGLSSTVSADTFPVSVTPPNNGTTLTSTTSAGAKIYTKPTATQNKTAFVKSPLVNPFLR